MQNKHSARYIGRKEGEKGRAGEEGVCMLYRVRRVSEWRKKGDMKIKGLREGQVSTGVSERVSVKQWWRGGGGGAERRETWRMEPCQPYSILSWHSSRRVKEDWSLFYRGSEPLLSSQVLQGEYMALIFPSSLSISSCVCNLLQWDKLRSGAKDQLMNRDANIHTRMYRVWTMSGK